MIRVTIRVVLLGLVCAVALPFGCGGGGGGEEDPEFLRIVNAAFDAEELNVSLGEEPLRLVVPYGQSTVYTEVPEGTLTVRIRVGDEVLPSVAADLSIAAGADVTYLVAQEADDTLSGTALTDNNDDPKGGLFKIRFVNAGTNDPVDFYVTLPGDDVDDTAASGSNVAFKAASAYAEIDPGTFRIHVTQTGSDDDLIESDDVALEAGKVYTVIFLEKAGGGRPFRLLFLADT